MTLLLVACIGGVQVPIGSSGYQLVWTDATQEQWASEVVAKALKTLPERLQLLIQARFEERVTFKAYGQRIGVSRERARQMEAKALRILRGRLRGWQLMALQKAVQVVPVLGGPHDPAWITVRVGSELTELCAAQVRYLCRTGRVVTRPRFHKRAPYRIGRESLKRYVLGVPRRNRRRGIWKGG